MNRIATILFLVSFLIFILPISTNKTVAKQFSMAVSSEEDDGTLKGFNVSDYIIKTLPLKKVSLHSDIYYLLSKEKFTFYIHHTFPVDWLETFSPPPDLS